MPFIDMVGAHNKNCNLIMINQLSVDNLCAEEINYSRYSRVIMHTIGSNNLDYIYIYIYIYVYLQTIYIPTEREREREREYFSL